jgi:hypothetical protein
MLKHINMILHFIFICVIFLLRDLCIGIKVLMYVSAGTGRIRSYNQLVHPPDSLFKYISLGKFQIIIQHRLIICHIFLVESVLDIVQLLPVWLKCAIDCQFEKKKGSPALVKYL